MLSKTMEVVLLMGVSYLFLKNKIVIEQEKQKKTLKTHMSHQYILLLLYKNVREKSLERKGKVYVLKMLTYIKSEDFCTLLYT